MYTIRQTVSGKKTFQEIGAATHIGQTPTSSNLQAYYVLLQVGCNLEVSMLLQIEYEEERVRTTFLTSLELTNITEVFEVEPATLQVFQQRCWNSDFADQQSLILE
jgi:hypothetical protein